MPSETVETITCARCSAEVPAAEANRYGSGWGMTGGTDPRWYCPRCKSYALYPGHASAQQVIDAFTRDYGHEPSEVMQTGGGWVVGPKAIEEQSDVAV